MRAGSGALSVTLFKVRPFPRLIPYCNHKSLLRKPVYKKRAMAFVLSCRSPCAALAGSRAQAVPPSTALVHRTYSTSSCRGFARTSGQPSGAGFSQGQHARQVQCAVAQPPSSPLMSSESAPVLVEEVGRGRSQADGPSGGCREGCRPMHVHVHQHVLDQIFGTPNAASCRGPRQPHYK